MGGRRSWGVVEAAEIEGVGRVVEEAVEVEVEQVGGSRRLRESDGGALGTKGVEDGRTEEH